MNNHPRTKVFRNEATQRLRLAASIALFLVAATLPYVWLIDHFGYDDILREPAADILTKFHAGGPPLVMAWFGFAMSSLLFIPVALGFDRWPAASALHNGAAVTHGVASALAQAIGLLRWVLVVPALAAGFADPHSDAPTRHALLVTFDTVHRYGGMVIGEMIGQLLLAGWTALVAWRLWSAAAVPRWLAAIGLLTLPLWLLGQTELLHPVLPSIPSIEVIPIAFMVWEAWLAMLTVALVIGALRRPVIRGTTAAPPEI